MRVDKDMETTDVVIVGCGPTGALLTTLLGRFGIQNVVLEKQPGVTDDPRGITLDEDGIRMLQEVGLYDKIYTEMGSGGCSFVIEGLICVLTEHAIAIGMVNFMTSRNNLHERPFLRFNMDTVRLSPSNGLS